MLKRTGFLPYIFNWFRRDTAASSSDASLPRLGGTPSYIVGDDSALQIAAVYGCVRVLCNSVASLPLRILKRTSDGIFVEDEGSSLGYLLRVQPNEDYNAFDFYSQIVRQVLLSGNAYVLPVWSQSVLGEVERFVLCSRYSVTYDKYTRTYSVNDAENGISGTYSEGEILHFKNFAMDGKQGQSVLSFARQTMGIAASGDGETYNRFTYGGNVRGLVSNDNSVRGFGEYADDELKKTADNIDSRFRSGDRIVNLPGQAKFDQLSLSSVDMEFLSTRKFSVIEICRFFGVPPSYVFEDTSNNYKSVEMSNLAFLSQTLSPLLKQMEQEFLRKLVSPSRAARRRFEFDRRDLYSTDLVTRADYQTKTIASGVYTVNDWRRYENNAPVEGGDTILVSANLKSLDAVRNENQNIQKNGK